MITCLNRSCCINYFSIAVTTGFFNRNMSNNKCNVLHINNEEVLDMVVTSDVQGNCEIYSSRYFRYVHRLNNSVKKSTKNVVIIKGKAYPETTIISDISGNNYISNNENMPQNNFNVNEENNLFTSVLKKCEKKDSNQQFINDHLLKKQTLMQNKLKEAAEFFNDKLFNHANESYKNILTLIETNEYPDEFKLTKSDIFNIKFAYARSKMNMGVYNELKSASEIFTALKDNPDVTCPLVLYSLAQTHYLMDNFNVAKEQFASCLQLIKKYDSLPEIRLPGTDKVLIQRTEKNKFIEHIDIFLNECNQVRHSDFKCFYPPCVMKEIFLNSISFNGYVCLKCSQDCKFIYHRECWKKNIKSEDLKGNYFLNTICKTSDCGGVYSEFCIYDASASLITHIKKPEIDKVKRDVKESESKNNFKEKQKTTAKQTVVDKVDLEESKIEKIEESQTEQIKDNMAEYNPNMNYSAQNYYPQDGTNFNGFMPSNLERRLYKYRQPNSIQQKMNEHYSAYQYVNPNFVANPIKEVADTASQTELDVAQLQQENIRIKQNFIRKITVCERAYKDLLERYDKIRTEKKTTTAYVQTDPEIPCEECAMKTNDYMKLEKAYKSANARLQKLDELFMNQKKELDKIKKEKSAMAAEISKMTMEKDVLTKSVCDLQNKITARDEDMSDLCIMNDKLNDTIRDLQNKLTTIRNEPVAKVKDIVPMVDILCKLFNFHDVYLNTYKTKCKHMLNELEKFVQTVGLNNSLIPIDEIQRQILHWQYSLSEANQEHYIWQTYYMDTAGKLATKNYSSITSPPNTPCLKEEPVYNVFEHFFKISYPIYVKKLAHYEQQIEMIYKMYGPQTHSNQLVTNNGFKQVVYALNTNNNNNNNTVSPNVPVLTSIPPQSTANIVNCLQNPISVKTTSSNPMINELSQSNQSTIQQTEVFDDSCHGDTGAAAAASTSATVKSKKEVCGPQNLLQLLQTKFPQCSTQLLQKAMDTLKNKHGSLSSLTGRQILTETQEILMQLKMACFTVNNIKTTENLVETCRICLEFLTKDIKQLPCKHAFHVPCFDEWMKIEISCPICRLLIFNC